MKEDIEYLIGHIKLKIDLIKSTEWELLDEQELFNTILQCGDLLDGVSKLHKIAMRIDIDNKE